MCRLPAYNGTMKWVNHFWLAAVLVLGCSGSSDSNSTCSSGSTCGGDITGHWTIASSCVSATLSASDAASCPGATVSSTGLSVTGTGTYNADKTYTEVSTLSGSLTVTTPLSCLTKNGVTPTCAQANDSLTQKTADPSYPYSAVACQAAGNGCSCQFTLRSTAMTETGTYTTSAGVITQQSSTGEASTTNYCVSGNTLTQSPDPSSGLSGTITLTK